MPNDTERLLARLNRIIVRTIAIVAVVQALVVWTLIREILANSAALDANRMVAAQTGDSLVRILRSAQDSGSVQRAMLRQALESRRDRP